MDSDNTGNGYMILMLGQSGVGNYTFSIRLDKNEFLETNPIICAIFKDYYLNINNEQVKFRLFNVPGQEFFRSIALSYAKKAVGIILSYDITNRESFDELKKILRQVRDVAICNPVFMLIGMKKDLENNRKVTIEEGIKFAQKEGMMFTETSSLANINVHESVTNLIIAIYNRQKSKKNPYVNYVNQISQPKPQDKKTVQIINQNVNLPKIYSIHQEIDKKMSNVQNQNQLKMIDDKNFIYKNELYPFNFESFKNHSQYFVRNQDQMKDQKNINLVNEFDINTNILPESIRAMIEFSKSKKIDINKLYIPDLIYLANKYEITQLINMIDDQLLLYDERIITEIFSKKSINEIDVTYFCEDIISKNMQFAIDNYEEQILSFPFHLIYRILQKYKMNGKLYDDGSKFNKFIMKIIKTHGIQILSLLMELRIMQINPDVLNELFLTYFRETRINNIDPNLMYIAFEMNHEINLLQHEVKSLKKEIEYQKSIIFSSIKSITIPSDMTTIPSNYFEGKSYLQEINISQSIINIGNNSFSKCTSLTSITIPSSVKSIGSGCFSDCKSLTQINIMAQLTSIESHLFDGCTNLKTIKILETVTKIGEYAFHDCSSLNNVIIPESVVQIGYECFSGCSSLNQVKILGQLKIIEFCSFSDCTALKKIEIPSSVEKIESCSFKGCTNLKQVFFKCDSNKSYSLKEIKENAFEDCSALTSINIPKSANKINQNAFFGCTSLDIGLPGTKNWSYDW